MVLEERTSDAMASVIPLKTGHRSSVRITHVIHGAATVARRGFQVYPSLLSS
jgi:hypothetical protein